MSEVKSDEVLTDCFGSFPLILITPQGEGEVRQSVGPVLRSSSEHAVSILQVVG